MSHEETIDRIRAQMEERKRVTLSEGRLLLERLEEAAAEIARLQAGQSEAAPAPPAGEAAAAEPLDTAAPSVPEPLQTLFAEAGASAAVAAPDSVASSLYAWCSEWLEIRSRLEVFFEQERQLQADIERLEQNAQQLIQRLSS